MIDAEPAIRQMIVIDFENKIDETISVSFNLKIIKTIKAPLLEMAKETRQLIWNQAENARKNQLQLVEKEAQNKMELRNSKVREINIKIDKYNQAILGINTCLESMNLSEYNLPLIQEQSASSQHSHFSITVAPNNDIKETSDFIEDNNEKKDNENRNPVLQRPNSPQTSSTIKNELQFGSLVECKVTGLREFSIFVEFKNKKGLIHKSNISGSFVDILDSNSHDFSIGKSIFAIYMAEDEKGIS
jgi:hypothetical protein